MDTYKIIINRFINGGDITNSHVVYMRVPRGLFSNQDIKNMLDNFYDNGDIIIEVIQEEDEDYKKQR